MSTVLRLPVHCCGTCEHWYTQEMTAGACTVNRVYRADVGEWLPVITLDMDVCTKWSSAVPDLDRPQPETAEALIASALGTTPDRIGLAEEAAPAADAPKDATTLVGNMYRACEDEGKTNE